MTPAKLALSVAIVTRNRPESLQMTLDSLAKQLPRPFEILISDDSNTEAMVASNQQLAQQYGCRYLSGPQRGLYANRNFVARHMAGTHLRTMDDDHEFPENHLQVCMEAIAADDSAVWTIGEYFPSDAERPLPSPVPGQLHPRGFSYPPPDMAQYYGISCGASIYPRAVVDDGILNLESYKFGILYLEYGARLLNSGYRIKCLDRTYVIHHMVESSVTSREIIDSARVFSMLMLSFLHRKTLGNQLLTSAQILSEIFRGRYSPQLVLNAYREYKLRAKELKESKAKASAGRPAARR